MTFPQAHKGIKKVFIAEILEIISVMLIIAVTAISLTATAEENAGLAIAVLSLAAAAGVVAIVGFILQLVGLHQGGKDEPFFKIGFWVIILSIAFSIVSTSLKLVQNANLDFLTSVFDTLVDVSSVIVLAYLLAGIGALAAQLGDEFMVNRSRFLVYAVVGLYLLSIILGILAKAFPVLVLLGIFGIGSAVIELILYILCLIHIARAVKMLEK